MTRIHRVIFNNWWLVRAYVGFWLYCSGRRAQLLGNRVQGASVPRT